VRAIVGVQVAQQSQPGRRTDERGQQPSYPIDSKEEKGKEKEVVSVIPEKATASNCSALSSNAGLDKEFFKQQPVCFVCGKVRFSHPKGHWCVDPTKAKKGGQRNNVWQKKPNLGSGGSAALVASVNDALAQAKGAQDCSREMGKVAVELETENTNLNKELGQKTEKLEAFQAKEAALQEQQSAKHAKMLKHFKCHYNNKDEEAGSLRFIFFVWVVPLLQIVLAMYWFEMLQDLLWWPYITTAVCTLIVVFFWDRRRCFESGRQPYFFATPVVHTYRFEKICKGEKWMHGDERPESHLVSEMKYEAYYAKFNYTVTKHHSVVKIQRRRIVSVELLVQLTSNARIMLSDDEAVALDRMTQTAAAFKCINISKFLALKENIVKNTLAVAHGMWKRNQRRQFGDF